MGCNFCPRWLLTYQSLENNVSKWISRNNFSCFDSNFTMNWGVFCGMSNWYEAIHGLVNRFREKSRQTILHETTVIRSMPHYHILPTSSLRRTKKTPHSLSLRPRHNKTSLVSSRSDLCFSFPLWVCVKILLDRATSIVYTTAFFMFNVTTRWDLCFKVIR